ncbi:MAG: CPBP family intramembrane metalloprotease [Candidatus Omnitrophica bacterium]|nr:CPBP family intramembrane metalloprotease [Candidatus Omnitrophota bacterium]
MGRFTDFLRRERLYLLLLIFIAIFTAVVISTPSSDDPAAKKPAGISRAAAAADMDAEREAVEKAFIQNRHLAIVFGLVTFLIMALFLLGVTLDTILIISRSAGQEHAVKTSGRMNVPWSMLDVAKFAILFVFFSYVLLLVEASLARMLPVFKEDNFRIIFNTSIMDIVAVTLILYFTVWQYKGKFASLGLTFKNFARNVYYGIIGYIAFIPILVGIIAVIAVTVNITKYTIPRQEVVEIFLKERNATFLLYTSIFAAIAGPIIEEIFFRGFMYTAVKKYLGVFWAMLITAALFALLHAHMVGFLPILALGMLLAYLYEKTGTLISSMTVHVIHNLGMVFLVFLVKQLGVY